MSQPKRAVEMTREAREAHDALFHRVGDLHCVLRCAAKTFGDFDGMSDDQASAAVVVHRTVADLAAIRDDLERWEVKYAN